MTKEYSDYLAHHGVKGQKWGIRRYQNEDGTLKNPKGRRKPESATWKSRDAKKLSDEELNRRNSRLQRENQYKQLTQSNTSKALKWIGRTASAVLVASLIAASKGKMQAVYKKGLEKAAPFIKKHGSDKIGKFIKDQRTLWYVRTGM